MSETRGAEAEGAGAAPVIDPARLNAATRAGMEDLRQKQPAFMSAFGELGRAAYADGAISARHKEMMAIAIAVAGRCDGCIAWHVRSAIRLGMTRAELEELVAVAIHMGGGPSLIAGTAALSAFDQLSA